MLELDTNDATFLWARKPASKTCKGPEPLPQTAPPARRVTSSVQNLHVAFSVARHEMTWTYVKCRPAIWEFALCAVHCFSCFCMVFCMAKNYTLQFPANASKRVKPFLNSWELKEMRIQFFLKLRRANNVRRGAKGQGQESVHLVHVQNLQLLGVDSKMVNCNINHW